jgi:protein-tyrosine phosphatase
MTLAPGKKNDGFTGKWNRDLKTDLERLRTQYATTCLVSLMEYFEYEQVGVPTFFEEAEAAGIDVLWYPLEDMAPPFSEAQTRKVVNEIVKRASAGENVVIHCKGGIGRTGTIASCVLVHLGFSAADAIREVQKTRKSTITRKSQQKFVKNFTPGP